jgi:hypothetical protein
MKKIKLPRDVLFHHDLQLMVFRPRGILDEKVVDEIVAFLEKAEEKADKPFNRYSDLSKLKAIHLDFNYVVRVSLHRRLTYMKRPPVKSAFFVSNEETAHIVDIHILMTDHSPLQVAMFRDVPAAAQWLGVSAEDLQIGE